MEIGLLLFAGFVIGGIVGWVLGYEDNIRDTDITDELIRSTVRRTIDELEGGACDGRKL